MTVALIVPRLPPARDGLGDYCRRLWESWPGARPTWTLLVTEGAEASRASWPEARIDRFDTDGPGLLEALAGAETVALLYVPHAYHPAGCPAWLPGALRAWKAAGRGRRLVVMFHELWAEGPPWRRAFWTRRTQVHLALEIASLADVALTSTEVLRGELRARFGVEAEALPVPSTLPVESRCWPDGETAAAGLRLWVFGLPAVRREALEKHRGLIAELASRGRLHAIVVAGAGLRPGDPDAAEALLLRRFAPGTRMENVGELAAPELSAHLGRCHVALIATPASYLPKSTTAMAALAHACPIVAVRDADPAEGVPYLPHDGSRRSARALADGFVPDRLREVGRMGRDWYLRCADWSRVAPRWRVHLEGS